QVELLRLIHDYLVIKKSGEEFGRIAVEKEYATPTEVKDALAVQRESFRKSRLKKMIGDILVTAAVISPDQKDEILTEQADLEREAHRILAPSPTQGPDPAELSDYERRFLKIQVLDREFAARALEKGFATEREIILAQRVQEDAFGKDNQLKLLGDIMVSMGCLEEGQKNTILQEQNRSHGPSPSPKADQPDLTLTPSEDAMEARVEIHAPDRVDLARIKAEAKEKGISQGLYPDALLQAHLDAGLTDFPVACLDHSDTFMAQAGCQLKLASDATTETPKGTPLATQARHPVGYGKTDLTGSHQTRPPGKDTGFRCGGNTRAAREGIGIVASKTGIPHLSLERRIFVHPIIHILEDADLRYGPIEGHAHITVSGVLTGAYPITAGMIKAREIRGAVIEAQGDITTRLGISDATIRTQGRVTARYVHNCRIESLGDIHVEKEVLDSTLLTSGAMTSPGCRIINSRVHAKGGVDLKGVGSNKTRPCIVSAGTEHHMVALHRGLLKKMDGVRKKEREFQEKIDQQKKESQKMFQRMVELKIFHDRAKKKKERLAQEIKRSAKKISKDKQKNILKLISNFETRMEKSIHTLKQFNLKKKKYDAEKTKLEKKLNLLRPTLEKKILSLEQDRIAWFQWTRNQKSNPEIKIHGTAFQGNIFQGVFTDQALAADTHFFSAKETAPSPNARVEISPLK
ncbi:MAG: FapA family protein, partial [Desulfobacterales bacterium]|nr:FapA family protein [Desulfobacterales bacterium]